MRRVSSLVVISFGLMCLTLSVMFAANLLADLAPDRGLLTNPWVLSVIFVTILGFLGFGLFMKKTLRQLNP